MKTLISLSLVLFLFLPTQAQKINRKTYIQNKIRTLEQAARYGEASVYLNSLYDLMVWDAGNSIRWKDSLARFYFAQGRYPQAILLTDELMKARPDEEAYWQIQAQAYEALGQIKKAIPLYEKLAERHPGDIPVLYRLAWNQYKLKRSEEAYTTLRKINPDSIPAGFTVYLPAGPEKTQAVPLKAAYFNLLGLVAYDLHNLDMAINYFDKALKEFPDFLSAKQNKAALELMRAKLNKQPAPTQTPPSK